ncbi:NAD(P)-binding protein [Calocera cornea HHB12733]|uniref:NAD(P)-binding protein n=1 Tax=Calocera cornea HHB12733 TaxID=1353952 RepID=A0A165I085_9BASI|nr:NAD(P)-binding protein [Calocera cornea HHB12733]
MHQKLVAVCGATGKQGGSVVNALLEHGGYSIRGLTRDLASPSSQALAAKGVDMAAAETFDKESLVKAFQGAYAVFGMTVSHTEHSETDLGKNIVDACRANNVPLLVWSSLPSARETSNGKYTNVRGFDEKAEVDKYIASSGQPTVIFQTGGFTENLFTGRQLQQDPTSPSKWHVVYPFAAPDLVLACSWIEHDMGPSVLAVVDKWADAAWREELTKAKIPMCSYRITGREMAETIQRGVGSGSDGRTVTGRQTEYITADTCYPPVIPLHQWQADGYYTYAGSIPPNILVKAGVQFGTFEEYVREKVLPVVSKSST